jgi:hypothetical protein
VLKIGENAQDLGGLRVSGIFIKKVVFYLAERQVKMVNS